jgi:YwqJ-like deaminase
MAYLSTRLHPAPFPRKTDFASLRAAAWGGCVTNPIVKALEEAAERIGKTLSKDAGKAVENMYCSAGKGTEDVIKRITEADAKHASKLVDLAEKMGQGGEKALVSDAEHGAEQTALRGKFSEILDPGSASGEGRAASSFLKNEEGIPGAGPGTKRLGTLAESDVTRDENGLITHVSGKPVDDYLHDLSKERADLYKRAKEDRTFPRAQQGNCVATGLDRRTGTVYEGINGKDTDVITPDGLHPTLQANRDALIQAGPYQWRDGTADHSLPFPDSELGHAEVKAANQALWDRAAAGLPTGKDSLGELSMSPYFPYIKGGMPAPFCPNCNGMLDGVHSTTGRLSE